MNAPVTGQSTCFTLQIDRQRTWTRCWTTEQGLSPRAPSKTKALFRGSYFHAPHMHRPSLCPLFIAHHLHWCSNLQCYADNCVSIVIKVRKLEARIRGNCFTELFLLNGILKEQERGIYIPLKCKGNSWSDASLQHKKEHKLQHNSPNTLIVEVFETQHQNITMHCSSISWDITQRMAAKL